MKDNLSHYLKLFFNKVVSPFSHILVTPAGFGPEQPGLGFDTANPKQRPLALPLSIFSPSNRSELILTLKTYFQSLMEQEQLAIYAEHMRKALDFFFEEAKRFALITVYYQQEFPGKENEARLRSIYDTTIPLQSSQGFKEIRPALEKRMTENPAPHQKKVLELMHEKASVIFDRVFSLEEMSKLIVGFSKSKESVEKIILGWRTILIQKRLKNIDAFAHDMQHFVTAHLPPTGALEKMQRYYSVVIHRLLQNPDIFPMLQTVLSDPEIRIVIARGYEIDSQSREPPYSFVTNAAALFSLRDATIYLSHPEKDGVPFATCVFQGVNTSVEFPGAFETPKIMFDEFMHAAAWLAFQHKGGSMLPYSNPREEEAYLLAWKKDATYIKNLAQRSVPTRDIFSALQKLLQYTTHQLLSYNNNAAMMDRFRNLPAGTHFLTNTDSTAQLIATIPPNRIFKEGFLYSVSQEKRRLTKKDYYALFKQLISELIGNDAEIQAHYQPHGEHIGTREAINRLPIVKWGSNITALVMPNLYRYFKDTFLPACQARLHNTSQTLESMVIPTQEEGMSFFETKVGKYVALPITLGSIENVQVYNDSDSKALVLWTPPTVPSHQKLISRISAVAAPGLAQGIAQTYGYFLKEKRGESERSAAASSTCLFIILYFIFRVHAPFSEQSVSPSDVLRELLTLSVIQYLTSYTRTKLHQHEKTFFSKGSIFRAKGCAFLNISTNIAACIYTAYLSGVSETVLRMTSNFLVVTATVKAGKYMVDKCCLPKCLT